MRRRPALKRRNSDDNLQASVAAEDEGAAEEALPLSNSAPAGSGLLLAEAGREMGSRGTESGVTAAAVRHVRWGATQVAGRGVAVLSTAASSTTTVLRSTSGLLRRMWGSDAAVGNGTEGADEEDDEGTGSPFSPAIGTATGAPSAMEIDAEDAVPATGSVDVAAAVRSTSRERQSVRQPELELDSS